MPLLEPSRVADESRKHPAVRRERLQQLRDVAKRKCKGRRWKERSSNPVRCIEHGSAARGRRNAMRCSVRGATATWPQSHYHRARRPGPAPQALRAVAPPADLLPRSGGRRRGRGSKTLDHQIPNDPHKIVGPGGTIAGVKFKPSRHCSSIATDVWHPRFSVQLGFYPAVLPPRSESTREMSYCTPKSRRIKSLT